MHEIGHNFAPYISGATYAWNWNEEIFANFRMFYALEKLNAKVITTASVVQADGSFESQEKRIQVQNFYNYINQKQITVTIGQ